MQLAHHLDPVDPRQHQVEHDQVGTVLGGEPQRLGAVGGAVGLVAGPLHVAADDLDDRRLVVDDQHGALGGVGHRRDCRAWRADSRLAEGEGIALHPRFRFQVEHVVVDLRQVDEVVEALAGHGDGAAVDVGAGVGGGDRLAVEQDLDLRGSRPGEPSTR